VAEASERHFLVRIEEGQCTWYSEVSREDDEVELDYRFHGPASIFDEIAAGTLDPIDAALRGTVRVRGDMRFLLRQAELVKTLLEAYAAGVETTWPKGGPPYGGPAGDGDGDPSSGGGRGRGRGQEDEAAHA
jgi:hypothetical protein